MAKKEEVQEIFNSIAPKYDFLNHLLSMGIDNKWRKKSIKFISSENKRVILDVACGTGDFTFTALDNGVKHVVGIDISENMLKVAKQKLLQQKRIGKAEFIYGDSENINFENDTFDAVIVGFGVRNFENLEKGLREMYRVVKESGDVVILEFSTPEKFPMKQLYNFYFKRILPLTGGWISGNRKAYQYLPESVFAFPQGKDFMKIMKKCGYKNVKQKKLTFGIATIYMGQKFSNYFTS